MAKNYKALQLTLIVKQLEGEHPVELLDTVRAAKSIEEMVRGGATGGITLFNVPHTHMGHPDTARYEVEWQIKEPNSA